MVAIASNRSKTREFSTGAHDLGGGKDGLLSEQSEPVIDLVHLSRQTMSDQALELELLAMFERQSARTILQLRGVSAGDAKLRSELAHTLRGSALAIGAARVARSAQVYEASCASPTQGAATQAALAGLADAVAEATATIAQLLGR
jgi:HPt (histidine-containing phosphotransfer) domain-containing protein